MNRHANLAKVAIAAWVVCHLAAMPAGAEDIRVGIFTDRDTDAKDVVAKALQDKGLQTQFLTAREVSAGKIHGCQALFFGEGWNTYDWIDARGQMQLVEFVQKRGGGAIFSMFRCGSAARSMIRPIFPEVADAYNKVNCRGIVVTDPKHPVMEGFPARFATPYWDHAVLRLGPDGRMLASDSNGDVSIACGEVGLGRVVFLGPWIGLDRDGKPVSPLPDVDEKLLLNAVRWAAGSPYRKSGGSEEVANDVKLKVLRRERILDWTHDERGMSWYVGILTKAMYLAEEKLDDLTFRTRRLLASPADPAAASELLRLHNQLGSLKTDLRHKYDLAKREKIADISQMTVEQLEQEPFRSLTSYRSMKPAEKALEEQRIEQWKNRLVPPHEVGPLEEQVLRLEKDLAPKMQKARGKAADEARARDRALVPGLIAQLAEPDAKKREKAALELGRIGDERAIKPLIKALDDPDRSVMRNAIQALGWLRAGSAVPALTKLANATNDANARRRAVQALGQIGSATGPSASSISSTLIQALKDPDPFVRQNAILALGWLGDKKAVEPLTQIVQWPGIEFGPTAPVFAPKDAWTREDVVCAIRALGHIGDKAALPALEEFAEKHKAKKEEAGRFDPFLTVWQALESAIKEIEAGGRAGGGIEQPGFLTQTEHFYWLPGQYNALYGRYWDYGNYPQDVRVMAGYAASSGGTGLIQWRSADAIAEMRPGADEYMAYFSELGLKQNPCFRWRNSAVFDKAGFEKDVLRWGQYPALGGFWAEEALSWDAALHNDQRFQEYLARRYSREELAALGIADISAVTCPKLDTDGKGRPASRAWDAPRAQKVLFAEYLEFLADTGVEIWQETQEWLMGVRKGTYLTFSLSQRYNKGGSTYISAYPRISQVIGANGPQSYEAHSYMNNFDLDMICDGEPRPALGEFYAHQADTPGRVERGFASSFLHGQCFFVWWWGHVFKHAPDSNGGSLCWDKGRWEAAERQFRKGSAISEYLAPQETRTPKIVAQLYSGRTTCLTYGRGVIDGMGGYTSGGRMYRYTQHQEALWQAIIQSHLPVDMTWLETMSREKLGRYKVAVLSDAWSLKRQEVDWIRDWVRSGGFLVATGGSSLHDAWDRPLANYALADVFGVDYLKSEMAGDPQDSYLFVDRDLKPETGVARMVVKDKALAKLMEGAESAEYERGIGVDLVEVTTGRVLAEWEDGSPAVVENAFGKGACVFLSPVCPGLSHVTSGWNVDDLYKDYWPGARELIAGCVCRGMGHAGVEVPVAVSNCPQRVEVGLRLQEHRNRWIVHLLNYDPKLTVVQGVELHVAVPSTDGLSVYYPHPERAQAAWTASGDRIALKVRDFSIHELLVLQWPDSAR